MASRKSYDLFNETKNTFEVRSREQAHSQPARTKPKDIPEVDDMRSVVGRMIGSSMPTSRRDQGVSEVRVEHSWDKKCRKASTMTIGPEDPAAIFYEGSDDPRSSGTTGVVGEAETISVVGVEGARRRKRRWSRQISKLKEFGSEAKSILYSSSLGV